MSASFAPECTEKKKKYDDCFNEWYISKFLKAKELTNPCYETWTEYQECLTKALENRGIKPMLDEARDEAPFEQGGAPNGDKKPVQKDKK